MKYNEFLSLCNGMEFEWRRGETHQGYKYLQKLLKCGKNNTGQVEFGRIIAEVSNEDFACHFNKLFVVVNNLAVVEHQPASSRERGESSLVNFMIRQQKGRERTRIEIYIYDYE